MMTGPEFRQVYLTHIESPGKFFVIDAEKMELAGRITQEISRYAPSMPLASESPRPYTFLKPMITRCLALWKDDYWHRALILGVSPDGSIQIEYIDYGEIATVEGDRIKRMPPSDLLKSTERLSYACCLTGDTHRMDGEKFRQLVTSHFCTMKIDFIDHESDLKFVSLFFNGNGENVNVNQAITVDVPRISKQLPTPAPVEPATVAQQPYHVSQSGDGETSKLPPNSYFGPMKKPDVKPLSPVSYNNNNYSNGTTRGAFGEQHLASWRGNLTTQDSNQRSGRMHLTIRDAASGQAGAKPIMHNQRPANYACVLDELFDGPYESSDDDDDEDDDEDGLPKMNNKRRVNKQPVTPTNSSGIGTSAPAFSPETGDEELTASSADLVKTLSLRLRPQCAPHVGGMASETQVTVGRIISPNEFYVQTNFQRAELAKIECVMDEEIFQDTPPIPARLIKADIPCAVWHTTKHVWRRARVISVNRENSTANIFCVDTGYEKELPLQSLKPLKEHLVGLPLMTYCVSLADMSYVDNWTAKETDIFKKLIDYESPEVHLIAKFVSGTRANPEIELKNMAHECKECSRRPRNCTVNALLLREALRLRRS